ncbi:MAG: TlpA family protein disulfide reductase [Prevotella sp.]|nr:TlpA family protein disulfide reductase [Prevotella sp.]
MKNRLLTTAACLLMVLTGQAQTSKSAQRIHEKIEAFVAAGEYNVSKGVVINSDEVTGSKTTLHSFSMMFAIENSTDSTLLFQHLRALEQTLRQETLHSKETYIHNGSEGLPLMRGVKINYGSKYGGISFNVKFDLRQRVRLIALDESKGYAYAVILVWEQRIIHDEQTGDHWMMNGKVYEVWGKKREGTPFIQPIAPISYNGTAEYAAEPTAPKTYEELLAKVKSICDIYQRETEGGKTAAVVILHKMCEGYPNKLTNEQYNTLIGIINPFVDEAKGQRHKDMFAYTCYTLYKKSEYYQEEGKARKRPAMIQSSTATVAQSHKFVSYNNLIVNESPNLQQVECQISGIAPMSADSVSLIRLVACEIIGKYPVKDGLFSFTCHLPKDELYYVAADPLNISFFWVDGHPVKVDLPHRSAKGSKASLRRNDFVNKAETERLWMLSLDDKEELAEATQKRIQRFRQAIFSGKDSLLAIYALFHNYTELTYDELKPFLRPDYRYAKHPLLSPVREYAAGLEKRRPNTRYTDILLADTLGEYHQLHEYIGRDYVVLHFWESWHRGEYDILPQLRTLYNKYHTTKRLQIVSLATDGMDNGQRWKERVKDEQLPWPQLTTKAAQAYGINSWPETLVIDKNGTIIASPQTADELSETLRKIAE